MKIDLKSELERVQRAAFDADRNGEYDWRDARLKLAYTTATTAVYEIVTEILGEDVLDGEEDHCICTTAQRLIEAIDSKAWNRLLVARLSASSRSQSKDQTPAGPESGTSERT